MKDGYKIKSLIVFLFFFMIEVGTLFGGEKHCPSNLDSTAFSQLLIQVAKHDFDDGKREAIEQGVENACLDIFQTLSLLSEFSFEEDRITLVKFLWNHVTDRSEFEKVLTAFEFESSKKEVRAFIAEHK